MASNHFVFDGLEELKRDLRNLPKELAGEAGHLVEAEANRAAHEIKQVYGAHAVTGNLRDGVNVNRIASGAFGVAWEVVSAAKHAWLFDNGSEARHWAGGKSTGRMWTKSPPTHAFVRTMIEARTRMYLVLARLLERFGLKAEVEPDAA